MTQRHQNNRVNMQKDTPQAGDVDYIENAGQFAKPAAPPEVTWTKEEEKKALWKLDRFLIPLWVCLGD